LEVSEWRVSSLDLIPTGSGDIKAFISASISTRDNFVLNCIGSNNSVLKINGFLGDVDCISKVISERASFTYVVTSNSTTQMTGSFDNPGEVQCHRNGDLGSPPPDIGNCVTGTQKSDNLIGTSKDDCIDGEKGNDKIAGLAGNDKLNGGGGKDLLVGGDGNDGLTGGKGADIFNCGAGNDKITDFNPSEGDKKTNDCEQFGHGLGDASGGFQ
jgi:Ca2+-binding RTX toxin-like protein